MTAAFAIRIAIVLSTFLLDDAKAPGLRWDGQPVHPGCIAQLTTDLADRRPVVAAVDLGGCSHSNRFAGGCEVEGPVLRWRNPDDQGRGYFEYSYVGVLTSGIHVLRVAESGGGSGIFQSLLFARISESQVLEDGQARVRSMLTLVGSEILGDRAQATVSLEGHVVTIRRREFQGAQGMGPEETIKRVLK